MNYQFEFSDDFMLPTLVGACELKHRSEDQSSQGVTVEAPQTGCRPRHVATLTPLLDASERCSLTSDVNDASAVQLQVETAGCKDADPVANAPKTNCWQPCRTLLHPDTVYAHAQTA
jgi:hypothetical protein